MRGESGGGREGGGGTSSSRPTHTKNTHTHSPLSTVPFFFSAIYESVVFLFVVHPFDVGDVVAVGTVSSDPASAPAFRVEEVCLLTTTLVRVGDGARVVWPNAKLAEAPLANLTRSGPRADSVRLIVDAAHVDAAVAAARRGAAAAVAAAPADFGTDVSVNVAAAGDAAPGLKLAVTLWWRVAGRGDATRGPAAKTGLLLAVARELGRAGVMFTSAPVGPAPAPVDGE